MKKDVAIIGMACIFPGAPDLAAYWRNILGGVDALSDPPPEYRADVYYDPASAENDRTYAKRGGYLKELTRFDPMKYGIMPRAVDGGDGEHFLALRVAYEALADAGYLEKPFDRTRTAIIIGRGTLSNRGYTTVIQHVVGVTQTLQILEKVVPGLGPEKLAEIRRELKAQLPPYSAETVPSVTSNILTGRIANRLDLMGPNYVVDAACASSIVALANAARELEEGNCDLAMAGGVHSGLTPAILTAFCQIGALSRSERLRPFDRDADGTLFGEGVGVVALKRLDDALRDGDRIYAVVRGVGLASDGRGAGLMAPRVEGEELALRRAYESAGVSPDTVDLVEAHGTGTPVGDLVEIQALTRVFGPRSGDLPRVAVGSAKSMVSHLIQAAGIAGLIKAALSVYHKVLPPTLHCDNPRPELEMRKTPFYINSETRPWIHGPAAPRRAGVSSFGFGGVDTHVVLEEAPGANAGPGLSRPWETEVFVVRGESRAALIAAGERLQRAASRGDGAALHDLAFSVNSELLDGGLRLAVVAGSLEDLKRKLAYALDRVRDERCSRIEDRSGIFFFERPLAREGSVAFLFPGESSQYVNMLSDLCVSFPEARAQFDRLDRLFLENRHPILPSQLLFPPPTAEPDEIAAVAGRLWEIEYAVGCVFAADRALYDILKGLEIAPHAVTGHSCGEYAALLIASGVVDIRSEEQLDGYTRELARIHDASRHLVPSAKLLTVALQDRDAILRAVSESGGELSIAMDNCPHQVILCGPDAAIGAAQEKLQALGALCTLLPFEQAYHTPHYRPVCEQYVPFFASLPIVPSPTVLYSCTTTEPCEQTSEVIRKVAGEQWSLPVRFRETIERMHRDGVRIFVEVGPRGNLTSFVDDILKGSDYAAVASNMANRSATTQINHMVGLLAAHGVHMKLDHLYVNRSPRRVDLDESQAAGIGKAGREIKLIFELPYLDASPTMLSAAAAAAASAASADRPDSAAPAAPAPTPARGASASVMVEYMKTMQGFLDMNSELALALARRKNGKRDGDAGQNGRAGGA